MADEPAAGSFTNQNHLKADDELIYARPGSDVGGNVPGSVFVAQQTPSGPYVCAGRLVGGFGAMSGTGTLDWSDASNCASGSGYNLLADTATNGPGGTGQAYHPFNFEYSSKNGTGNLTQFAIPYTAGAGPVWFRSKNSGAWTTWHHLLSSGSGNTYNPTSDNALALGSTARRFSVVYAGTGSINTSDRDLKRDIGDFPTELLDAWGAIRWGSFRFKDAFAEKGEEARYHAGLIAQEVEAALSAAGLDPFAYGLLCFDEWEAETAPITETRDITKTREISVPTGQFVEINDEPRELYAKETEEYVVQEVVETGEVRVIREAGSRYSLRYDECFAVEAAWQRRKVAAMEARLASLESFNG